MSERINQRRNSDWQMQLAIVQNPHVKDPKQLWTALRKHDPQRGQEKQEFDAAGFERLKAALSQNPRFVVK